MKQNADVIPVGFIVHDISKWWAGAVYFQNLLYAISTLETHLIKPVIFAGKIRHDQVINLFQKYAGIDFDTVLDQRTTKWLFGRILFRIFGRDYILERNFQRNKIAVVSHTLTGMKGGKTYRTIGWIPDFQHVHLPEMFSSDEITRRNRTNRDIAEKNDLVILSSEDALNDFRMYAPEYGHKGRILHFVAQPDPGVFKTDVRDSEKKFGIGEKYFFLPNQFWKHKNHGIVFEALKILKSRGHNILVICSGQMDDYRNRNHVDELIRYIESNGIERNVRMLGMIEKMDLFYLMRNSVSILNPSLFEGWSTTVEEAKSLGKSVILSDIAVHREQAPPGGIYFDPYNAEELADILMRKWDLSDGGPDAELEAAAIGGLPERTRRFGEAYQRIILELCG